MSSADNIEQSIAELNLTTRPETDKHILNDAYAALGKAVHKQQSRNDTSIWQVIFTNRYAVPTAVAAIILLTFALFINIRGDNAVNTENIYKALSKADNIHISTYQAGRANPDQQIWASKALGVKLLKTEFDNQAQYTLWDTENKIKMVKFLSSDYIQTEPITQQMLAELEKTTAVSADIIPFSDENDIPQQAQWIRMDDESETIAIAGTKAYELNWSDKSTESSVIIHKKWRVYADQRSKLPKRIEWYVKEKEGIEAKYAFVKFAIISYPGEDEIQDIIREVFGRQDDPEFIGTPEAYR